LDVEVSHISTHGIWLLTENQEFFLPYDEFPWFQDAKISNRGAGIFTGVT